MSRKLRLSPLLAGLLLPAAILLLAFALRVYRLGDQNVWWDEALAVWAVRKSFAGVTLWTAGDVHPPLYFWLLWPWVRLAGESEFAARYLTAALGVLAVAVSMAVGRRVARGQWPVAREEEAGARGQGPEVSVRRPGASAQDPDFASWTAADQAARAGVASSAPSPQPLVPSPSALTTDHWPLATLLLSGLFVATARFEVWWSQEMRMYMLAGLIALVSVYLTLRMCAMLWATTDGSPVHRILPVLLRRTGGPPCPPLASAGEGATTERSPIRVVREAAPRSFLSSWLPLLLVHALVNAAGLYTIYLYGVVILVEGAWLAWLALRGRAWRTLGAWAASTAVTAALVVPWLALALPRMHSWTVVTQPAPAGFVARLYTTLIALGISTDVERYLLPAAALVVLCLAGFVVATSRQSMRPLRLRAAWGTTLPHVEPAAGLLALFLVVPPLVVWMLTQPRALFYTPRVEARYLLPFAAPVYVLLAWSVTRIGRRWRPAGVVLAAAVIGTFAWSTPQYYTGRVLRDDLQSMVLTIRAYAQPGDAVALVSGNRYPIFLYYYDRQPGPRPNVLLLPQDAAAFTQDNVAGQLAPLLAKYPRLWLAEVDANLEDPRGLARQWLDGARPKALSLGFGHNALHLYGDPAPVGANGTAGPGADGRTPLSEPAVPAENLRPQFPLSLQLAPGIELLGYDLPIREANAGDRIYLGLYFRAETPARFGVDWWNVDWYRNSYTLETHPLDIPQSSGIVRRQVSFEVAGAMPAGSTRFVVTPFGGKPGAFYVTRSVEIKGTPRHTGSTFFYSTHASVEPGMALTSIWLGTAGDCTLPWTTPRDGRDAKGVDGSLRTVKYPKGDGPCILDLSLDWMAQQTQAESYKVFAHLVGQTHNPATGGPVWAGHDGEPSNGAYPTTEWGQGEPVVTDRHWLLVDPAAPPGVYQLEVGMYRPATGERLEVSGKDADAPARRIVLGTIELAR